MKTLQELWDSHDGRLADKWQSYFEVYERHFSRFRGKPCRILEIGVAHGGSLQLWKAYFGDQALIIGLDIDTRCLDYEEDRVQVYHGDQSDRKFMAALGEMAGPFDIVIDDGSHVDAHQTASFEALWEKYTRSTYLIEDCHVHYPYLGKPALRYEYPWVLVVEKPKRMIAGKASRPLNSDELAVYGPIDLYTDVQSV